MPVLYLSADKLTFAALMARILAVDYGLKRTGIAVTDPLQIIASGLPTVETKNLFAFFEHYLNSEIVDVVVVGKPMQMNNTASETEPEIKMFINKLQQKYKDLKIERYDERFTSKIALQTIAASGLKKKDRQNKSLADKVSATLILQSYLEFKNNKF